MLHSWLVHSSMNCTRSSTTELSDQLTLHSSEIGGKSLTLYTDYSVTTLIGGSVTNHAGRYPRRCTQECVRHICRPPCQPVFHELSRAGGPSQQGRKTTPNLSPLPHRFS